MSPTTQALITIAILLIAYYLLSRLERKVKIDELQHGQEIEVREGKQWYAARYKCRTPFKGYHFVHIAGLVTKVQSKDIRLVKQSKPLKVK